MRKTLSGIARAPRPYGRRRIVAMLRGDIEGLRVANLVFVGQVDQVEPQPEVQRERLTFQVIRRFKGTVETGRTMDFGWSGENFDFAVGQRVLVYALNIRGLMVTACTRTKLLAAAGEDLKELQTLVPEANQEPTQPGNDPVAVPKE